MASYQDIDVRLSVIEAKVDFLMKSFTATDTEGVTKNLLDVYLVTKALGVVLDQHAPTTPLPLPNKE